MSGVLRGEAAPEEAPVPPLRVAAAGDPGPAAKLVADLVTGDLRQLSFLRLGPTGLVRTTVVTDRVGVPCVAGAPEQWPIEALLPGLPEDPLRRRFHLAGGVGTGPTVDPHRLVAAGAAGLPVIALTPAAGLVIILPDPAWLTLARLAGAMRARYGPAAELEASVVGDDVLAWVLRSAPLRYDYELVGLAEVDGAVRLATRVLFHAGYTVSDGPAARDDGSVAAAGPTTEVTVRAPDGMADPVVLPIVVRRGDAPESWLPVQVLAARLPTEPLTLTATLTAPGAVDLPGLSGALPDARLWPDLLAGAPDPDETTLLDVVVAIELTAARAGLALALAADFAGRLADDAETVQLAAIGYGQDRDPADPVRQVGFHGPAAVREALAEWTPLGNRDDLAASLEDALATADGLPWRPGSRRILVVVGSRPPHPARVEDNAAVCRHHRDWQVVLDELRSRHEVRTVAVHDPPAWLAGDRPYGKARRRLDSAWRQLGTHGQYTLDEAGADLLARAVGAGRPDRAAPVPFAYLVPGRRVDAEPTDRRTP